MPQDLLARKYGKDSGEKLKAYQAACRRGEEARPLPVQLIAAAENGNLAEVERLIAAGANVNGKDRVTARAPTTVAHHARCRVSSLWRCCLDLSPLFPYTRRVG